MWWTNLADTLMLMSTLSFFQVFFGVCCPLTIEGTTNPRPPSANASAPPTATAHSNCLSTQRRTQGVQNDNDAASGGADTM